MKRKQLLNSIGLLMGVSLLNPLHGMTVISDDHVDIGIAYEGGAWDLHLHVEESFELEPDEGILYGSEANNALFKGAVPAGPNFSFLGSEGDPLWIFPQAELAGLPFLGIATEEIAPGVFVDDEVTLTFTGLSGPGDFFLFQDGILGAPPTVFFNSTDGFGESTTLGVQTHGHYNFVFTAEGVYNIGLQASGFLDDGSNTFTSSGVATYTFGVNAIPEPETYALWSGIFVAACIVLKRRMKKA